MKSIFLFLVKRFKLLFTSKTEDSIESYKLKCGIYELSCFTYCILGIFCLKTSLIYAGLLVSQTIASVGNDVLTLQMKKHWIKAVDRIL